MIAEPACFSHGSFTRSSPRRDRRCRGRLRDLLGRLVCRVLTRSSGADLRSQGPCLRTRRRMGVIGAERSDRGPAASAVGGCDSPAPEPRPDRSASSLVHAPPALGPIEPDGTNLPGADFGWVRCERSGVSISWVLRVDVPGSAASMTRTSDAGLTAPRSLSRSSEPLTERGDRACIPCGIERLAGEPVAR